MRLIQMSGRSVPIVPQVAYILKAASNMCGTSSTSSFGRISKQEGFSSIYPVAFGSLASVSDEFSLTLFTFRY